MITEISITVMALCMIFVFWQWRAQADDAARFHGYWLDAEARANAAELALCDPDADERTGFWMAMGAEMERQRNPNVIPIRPRVCKPHLKVLSTHAPAPDVNAS
jgi:hypothetical protein